MTNDPPNPHNVTLPSSMDGGAPNNIRDVITDLKHFREDLRERRDYHGDRATLEGSKYHAGLQQAYNHALKEVRGMIEEHENE